MSLVWPVDVIPDATVLAPHHYYIGPLVALFVILHVADDKPDKEPSFTILGVLVALFGFLTWQWHPIAGATLSHIGALILGISVFLPFMQQYNWQGHRGLLFIGWLVMMDDLIEHAWGIATPLDSILWADVIVPALQYLRQLLGG